MRMPMVFVGHGSPMNGIEQTTFSDGWRKIGEQLPKPSVILMLSAHWYTQGTHLLTAEKPKMIYDFYGFPEELYRVQYPAPGEPALARRVAERVPGAVMDGSWGLDHGAWTVLKWMFPEADIPVVPMSVNRGFTPRQAFETGALLKSLRDENILIMGSGNVVHNLRMVDFSKPDGFDWAMEFDAYILDAVRAMDAEKVIEYGQAGRAAALSVPTRDHFDPLLYVLGAADKDDSVEVWNQSCTLGSLSMTSYVFSN